MASPVAHLATIDAMPASGWGNRLGVMPQPMYVPLGAADRVRPAERLPVPEEWRASRPADIESFRQPAGKQMGSPGPDQGYGIKLAKRFADKLLLTQGEHEQDVMAGCLGVALKRAALFGRAPVIYDFEHAFTLWGFLSKAPDDLVTRRQDLFASASHHYEAQRAIADAVPEATLRLSPAEIAQQLDKKWRDLINI